VGLFITVLFVTLLHCSSAIETTSKRLFNCRAVIRNLDGYGHQCCPSNF